MQRTVYVYFDDETTAQPLLVGVLQSQIVRGKEVFSFEFADELLHSTRSHLLDPDLQLYRGKQYLPEGKNNFGLFLDSSPDRWGRMLLDRREGILAKAEQRERKRLQESDYLLGVFDESRMGALRLKLQPDGEFLDNNPLYSTPPLARLPKLEQASWECEGESNDSKWLRMLVAPGSSLGGARPKANVRMTDGALWIAKFPSRLDRMDIGAWEALTMTLAGQCGITVSPFMLKRLGQTHHTFLTRRFDRTQTQQRLHFTSAMTMLGYKDGDTLGCSYLELAEWISRFCCRVEDNLAQMWQRIVFNIAVSNCDDHIRNHGFLLTPQGWTLSPAYDLNPQPDGIGLSLNINEHDNTLDYSLALEVAPYFGVSQTKAEHYINTTVQTVVSWRTIAKQLSIPRSEQELMASAFKA